MNLYLISQDVNHGYDTYSDAVVAAVTEHEARNIHPDGDEDDHYEGDWAKPEQVNVTLIGTAVEGTETGVICASFHAG